MWQGGRELHDKGKKKLLLCPSVYTCGHESPVGVQPAGLRFELTLSDLVASAIDPSYWPKMVPYFVFVFIFNVFSL